MARKGNSGEMVQEEGIYICGDGCERRLYRQGEAFLICAVSDGATSWVRVEEQ